MKSWLPQRASRQVREADARTPPSPARSSHLHRFPGGGTSLRGTWQSLLPVRWDSRCSHMTHGSLHSVRLKVGLHAQLLAPKTTAKTPQTTPPTCKPRIRTLRQEKRFTAHVNCVDRAQMTPTRPRVPLAKHSSIQARTHHRPSKRQRRRQLRGNTSLVAV